MWPTDAGSLPWCTGTVPRRRRRLAYLPQPVVEMTHTIALLLGRLSVVGAMRRELVDLTLHELGIKVVVHAQRLNPLRLRLHPRRYLCDRDVFDRAVGQRRRGCFFRATFFGGWRNVLYRILGIIRIFARGCSSRYISFFFSFTANFRNNLRLFRNNVGLFRNNAANLGNMDHPAFCPTTHFEVSPLDGCRRDDPTREQFFVKKTHRTAVSHNL